MRREARPHHLAGEAKLIEKIGLVMMDAAREHIGLPSGGGNFIALKLFDDLQRAIHAMQPAAEDNVLPAVEEALELRGGDRFDLAAKPAEREAVDAGEDAAIAPFRFAFGEIRVETAAHHLAFGFELVQRGVDFVRSDR